MTGRTFRSTAMWGGLIATALVAAACGSDDDTVTTTPPTSSAPAETTPPPPAPTDNQPTDTQPSDETTVLDAGMVVEPGITYRTGSQFRSGVAVTLSSPVEAVGYVDRGFVGLSLDPDGLEPLLALIVVDEGAKVLVPVSVDLSQITSAADLAPLAEPFPDDFLSWFASRPYVDAAPITETMFAGLPARELAYTMRETDGGFPCSPDGANCWWSITIADTSLVHVTGDTGSMFEVDLGGRRIIVDVSTRDGAAEAAATITIS